MGCIVSSKYPNPPPFPYLSKSVCVAMFTSPAGPSEQAFNTSVWYLFLQESTHQKSTTMTRLLNEPSLPPVHSTLSTPHTYRPSHLPTHTYPLPPPHPLLHHANAIPDLKNLRSLAPIDTHTNSCVNTCIGFASRLFTMSILRNNLLFGGP